MANVLADLALEAEAAMYLGLRVARAMDQADDDPHAAAFARIATAIAKYWNSKRAPGHVFEAMECHGGSGYIEESVLPRLYREAPINSIWEGCGNVLCLDVLRAMAREPLTVTALFDELELARGGHPALDRAIDRLRAALDDHHHLEARARRLTEQMAVVLQAALMVRHASAAAADAFCQARLEDGLMAFGVLPVGTDFEAIINRALPPQAA
jgi:putative acyl-CoA dehydrogenase